MENSSDTDFVSVTKILLSACGNYSRGVQLKGKNAKLTELSNLAYTGFCNGQIIFQREEDSTRRLHCSFISKYNVGRPII